MKDLELEVEEAVWVKLRTYDRIITTCNGKRLRWANSDINRGDFPSYPMIKLYAQNQGTSLAEISRMLKVNYQYFVNCCNGRGKFKEEWKPKVAKILHTSEEELFGGN